MCAVARLRDVADIAHLERGGFGGELAEFRVGNALQQGIGINQACQPIEPLDPKPDGCRGCGTGRQLQPVEIGRCAVCRSDEKGVQNHPVFRRHTCGDPIVDARVDFRSQPIDQAIKSAERRQIHRCRPQRLNRSVDKVRGVAHGFGGLEGGSGNQLLARSAIRRDGKVCPNRRLIPVERFCFVSSSSHTDAVNPSCEAMCAIVSAWISSRSREVPEILARFQQRGQHQAPHFPTGAPANEGEVRLAQLISGTELVVGQPRTRAWVSRAINGCHGVSGKGSAVASGRSVCFEGDRR